MYAISVVLKGLMQRQAVRRRKGRGQKKNLSDSPLSKSADAATVEAIAVELKKRKRRETRILAWVTNSN
jgi:hypothetical protein